MPLPSLALSSISHHHPAQLSEDRGSGSSTSIPKGTAKTRPRGCQRWHRQSQHPRTQSPVQECHSGSVLPAQPPGLERDEAIPGGGCSIAVLLFSLFLAF